MASTQEKIVQRILDSPVGRAAIAEEAAEVDKRRATAIAGIERARRQHIAEGLALTTEVENAAVARSKAWEVALAADRRLGEATAARLGASAAASAEIAGYEAVLRETAPQVADLVTWLNSEYDRVRHGL
jgi:hypothetical protein